MEHTDIEISFDLKATVAGRFWIDRDEWNAMQPEARAARIQTFIDNANLQFDRTEMDIAGETGGVYVNATDIDGDYGVYDPDE